MLEIKTINICGEPCQVNLYGSEQGGPQWMHMLLEGTWGLIPGQAVRLREAEQRYQHLRFDFCAQDESVTIKRLKLVQFGAGAPSDVELEAMGDRFLTEIESMFPTLVDGCTSSSWWVGHGEDTLDALLTQSEQAILARAVHS